MKKLLLGSTALLTAALLSHGAMAQTAPAADSPVKLGISGFLQGGYLANLHETANAPGGNNTAGFGTGYQHSPDAVQEYGLLDFSGDTKFSNGIGAGAFIELYAFNHSDNGSQIRQSWVHVTGDSFGEVRIGDSTDVRRAQAVIAPEFAPDALFTVNSPDLGISNGGITSNTTTAVIGTKIPTSLTYYTPTLSGFKFGVSYAPDSSKGNTGAAPTASYVSGKVFRDEWSATGTWSGNLGPTAISASVGATGASTKPAVFGATNHANPIIYNAGFMMTQGPFSMGVSYEQAENIGGFQAAGTSEQINKTTDIGFTYTVGAITAGAEYSSGAYKNYYGPKTGTPKLNQFLTGASYAIGPGVSVTGGVAFNDYDTGGSQKLAPGVAPVGYDSVSLLMGTDVKF